MFDVNSLTEAQGHVQGRLEYQYWKNKFGNDSSVPISRRRRFRRVREDADDPAEYTLIVS